MVVTKPLDVPKKDDTLIDRCQRYSSRERGDWSWQGRPSHRGATVRAVLAQEKVRAITIRPF